MKKRKIQFIVILFAGFCIGIISFLNVAEVFAQVRTSVTNGFAYAGGLGLGTRDLRTIIFSIVNVILGFLAIVAVLIIAYGGLVWMTSRGNPQQVEKAKKILTNAVIGLVIIFLSYSIANFVFKMLMQATGVGGGGGGACAIPGVNPCTGSIPGFPTCVAHQDCLDTDGDGNPATGLWGFCLPDFPLDASCLPSVTICKSNDIKPKISDGKMPRNTKVRIYFSSALTKIGTPDDFRIQRTDNTGTLMALDGVVCNTNDDCASNNCVGGPPGICSGNYVSGTASLAGSVAEFTPNLPNDVDCPAPLKCFSKNAFYKVNISGAGVFKCNGANMVCGGGDVCTDRFEIGDMVDIQNPTIVLQPAQVCEGVPADFQANFKDDYGVTQVDFWGNGILLGNDNGPWGNPKDDIATFNGWVHGLLKGQIAQVRSVAIDFPGNTGQDTKQFTVRSQHCCNGNLDTAQGEEGIDCGGADCEACGLGPPIIDYVSPAIDPATPANFDDDQPHGTLDNLVTIFGRNFGTKPGTVEFLNGAGVGTPAQLAKTRYPGICTTNDWTDTSIIVAVPNLAAGNWPIRVMEATKGKCTDNSYCTMDGATPCPVAVAPCVAVQYIDVTNDIVLGERNIKDFLEDGKSLPGLCSVVNPITGDASGGFKDLVNLAGIKFNAVDLNSKVKFGDVGTNFGPWAMNAITNVSVPNLLVGSTAWVTVQINPAPGDVSNAMPFKVTPGVGAPVIYDFQPKDGNPGSYVTIVGANFGNKQGVGNVLFNGVGGNFTFPEKCSESYWTNSRIIVKAPAAATGIITVVTNSGGTANTSALSTPNFTYGTTVKPGICLIEPYLGPAGTTLVHIYGEKLDSVTSVTFHKGRINNIIGAPAEGTGNINVVAAPADKQEVITYVNKQAETGPVIVTDPIGDSNPLNYNVGICTKNDECQGGDECCMAGTSKGMCKLIGQCAGLPDVSAMSWYFTTGNLGPHVLKNCTRTSDCRPGGYSSPSPFFPRDGGQDLDGNGLPDGVPVDSLITASFDQLMNLGTLTLDAGGDGFLDNIIISECTDKTCAVLVGGSQLQGALSTLTWNYNGVVNSAHAILFSPNANLKKNTWYKVELKSGATGIKSAILQELVGDGGAGSSFTWIFLTKDSDAPGRAGCPDCHPKTTNLTEQYIAAPCKWGKNCSTITGDIFDQDNVCVQLKGIALTWAWQSLDAVRVQTFENLGDPANDKFIQIKSLKETLVDTPVKIEGTVDVAGVGSKKTTCDAFVNFGPPYISEKWPSCGSACINAEVGARFSRKMDAATLVPANIKVYACGSDIQCRTAAYMYDIGASVAVRDTAGTCGNGIIDAQEQCDDGNIINGDGCNDNCLLEGSNTKYGSICGNGGALQKGEGCDDGNTVSGDGCSSICLVENALEKGTAPTILTQTEAAMEIPFSYNKGYLVPGVYYRAVFSNAIISDEGKALGGLNWDDPANAVIVGKPDSYSWVFKTQEDFNLCAVNSVGVNPSLGYVAVNGKINFSAAPFSAPDSCSPQYGQRLNPILYEWVWDSNTPAQGDLLSDGAAPGLLNNPVGSNARDACGNRVKQLGEDCDEGNIISGDGCTGFNDNAAHLCSTYAVGVCTNAVHGNWCYWAGVACRMRPCLDETSAKVGVSDHSDKTICGNGKIELPDEECDDGNIINGDGCSGELAGNLVGGRRCVLEGTQTGKSVCGDGIVGFGESCETCGNGATARVITVGQTCGDSDFAFNRVPDGADGCSDKCILKAPSVLALGSDLLAPASICGNGVEENKEDCDDGGFVSGDGCSDICLHEGSVYNMPPNNPPNIGPYQIAYGVANGNTVIEARTMGKFGTGNLVIGTGVPGGPGAGAFRILDHYPNGGDNCQNQLAVLVFSKEPDSTTISFETVAGDGSNIVMTRSGLPYIIANKAMQIAYNGNQLEIKPNGGNVWEFGDYTITINNTLIRSTANEPLDCNGKCNDWNFTIVNKLCKPTRVDVTPAVANVPPNEWVKYYAQAYDDYKKPEMAAINQITDAVPLNNPVVSGTISCDYDMNICMKAVNDSGRFDIWAEKSRVTACNADVNDNLKIDLLYKTSDIQKEILLLGCGIAVKFTGLPATNDQWNISITPGFPVEVLGVNFNWKYTEFGGDKGDPAVWWMQNPAQNLPVASPPYNVGYPAPYNFPDIPNIPPLLPNINNKLQFFLSVSPNILNYDIVSNPPNQPPDPAGKANNWSPFSGFRHAEVIANVATSPDVKGSADFYVGNLCEEKYHNKTLYDIYPLFSDVNSAFLLHFDDSWKAETKNGLMNPITNNTVTFEQGLTSGTNILGKSARWNNAGKLSYKAKDNINPQQGTISFWFNQRTLPGSQYYFYIEQGTELFSISVDNAGQILFAILNANTGSMSFKTIPAQQTDSWHYLAAVWNAIPTAIEAEYEITTKLYIDGEMGNEISHVSGSKLSKAYDLMAVGSKNDFSNPIDANIDEFEIRYDALSAEDIKKRYIAGIKCLGASASEMPVVKKCAPSSDPLGCADVANLQCLNPQISATFNIDMDAASILHRNAGGLYDNILLYESGTPAIPENSFIKELSYNSIDRTVSVTAMGSPADSLNAGLVLNMSFDDKANPMKDESGNNNNGTCAGATCPQWTANGRFGGAFEFANNNTDKIVVADSNSLDISQALTISLWIYPRSDYLGYAVHPISKWVGTSDANYVLYYFGLLSAVGENRNVQFLATGSAFPINQDGDRWGRISRGYTVLLNQWYHVVLSYSSQGGGLLYINGVSQGVAVTGGVLTANAYDLRIGEINGAIDDVRIWNRNLSADEIKILYYNPNPVFIPGGTYAVRVKGGADGVKSDKGVAMDDTTDATGNADREWTFGIAAGAQLCNCDKVKVTVVTGTAPVKSEVKYNDVFTCAGTGIGIGIGCPDDIDNATAGNQHSYTAQCQDVSSGTPIDVAGTYVWTQNDPQKIFTWPLAPITTPSIIVTNTSVNGDASVTVVGQGDPAQGAGGKDEKTVSLTNFVCNNPWPSFDNISFEDVLGSPDAGTVTPYTNFKFFYCRDQNNTPSAIDDLPALNTGILPVAP